LDCASPLALWHRGAMKLGRYFAKAMAFLERKRDAPTLNDTFLLTYLYCRKGNVDKRGRWRRRGLVRRARMRQRTGGGGN